MGTIKPLYAKVGGAWKQVVDAQVRQSGAWSNCEYHQHTGGSMNLLFTPITQQPTLTLSHHGRRSLGFTWPALSEVEDYEWRIDGGAWTTVTTPDLNTGTGLTFNSTHKIEVRGKVGDLKGPITEWNGSTLPEWKTAPFWGPNEETGWTGSWNSTHLRWYNRSGTMMSMDNWAQPQAAKLTNGTQLLENNNNGVWIELGWDNGGGTRRIVQVTLYLKAGTGPMGINLDQQGSPVNLNSSSMTYTGNGGVNTHALFAPASNYNVNTTNCIHIWAKAPNAFHLNTVGVTYQTWHPGVPNPD